MRIIFSAVSLISLVAILWPTITPAYACTCFEQTLAERIGSADLIVVGEVVEVDFEGPIEPVGDSYAYPVVAGPADVAPDISGTLKLSVERYLKGEGSARIVVWQDGTIVTKEGEQSLVAFTGHGNCQTFDGVPIGERYILFLSGSESGEYSTGLCAGSAYLSGRSYITYDDSEYNDAYLKEVEELTQTKGDPAASEQIGDPDMTSDFPLILAAIAATLGPLAFLAASPFLYRRPRQ